MKVAISRSVLSRLDIERAVFDEVADPPRDLPTRVLERAVEDHVDKAAALITGYFQDGIDIAQRETVFVPKARASGRRPIALLAFPERVLYRALADSLRNYFEPLNRTFEAREAILEAPRAWKKAKYVVAVDVAAFYQYIDHDLLRDEIVAQTGEADIADSISLLLDAVSDRAFGVPQLHYSSHFLSEVFIAIVERRLLRAGLQMVRYTDDFRIGVTTYREVFEVLEQVDAELRRVGLVLNEAKTTWSAKKRYVAQLGVAEAQWEQITEEVEADLAEFDWYGGDRSGDDESDGPPEVWVPVAEKALSLWHEQMRETGSSDWLTAQAGRRLVALALSPLTRFAAPEGLRYVLAILVSEPQMTRMVSRYLSALVRGEHENLVIKQLEFLRARKTLHLSAWQALWLFQAVAEMEDAPQSLLDWVNSFLGTDLPDAVRAGCALVLAEQDQMSPSALGRLYESVSAASRPDVVAAIAKTCDDDSSLVKSVRTASPFNRWVVDSIRADEEAETAWGF